MNRLSQVIGILGALVLASLTALASFGLLLAAAWAVTGESPEQKLIAALFSGAIAIALGGFTFSLAAQSEGPAGPAALGLLSGGASTLYILGADVRVIPFAATGVLFSLAGSLLARSIRQRRKSKAVETSA